VLRLLRSKYGSPTQAKLANLAQQQGRDQALLVVEAIERLVDHDAWFLSGIDKGLAQIESGETLSHEEVGSQLEHCLSAKPSRNVSMDHFSCQK